MILGFFESLVGVGFDSTRAVDSLSCNPLAPWGLTRKDIWDNQVHNSVHIMTSYTLEQFVGKTTSEFKE
jgi:hypothetical protein